MQFGDIKDRVRQALGAADDEIDDEVERFIIDAVLDIHKAFRWPWTADSVTVKARQYLTGFTADWTLGSGTISTTTELDEVTSQAIADEYVGGLIELAGANKYEITAWTWADGAANTITVTPTVIDTTATGGAVRIIQDTVTLPATIESVIGVIDMLEGRELVARDGQWHSRSNPDPFLHLGATPSEYWIKGQAAGDLRLVLFPAPSADRIYYVKHYMRPTPPILDTTLDTAEMDATTGIPEQFHTVIVAGAIYRAMKYEFENIEHMNHWYTEYQVGLNDMKRYCKTNSGFLHVLGQQAYRRNVRLRYTETGKISGV